MNKPVAPSIATMIGLPGSAGIVLPAPAAPQSEEASLRRALHTLERIGGGWRPDESRLAEARQMERWTAARQEGGAYQFIGFAANAPNIASTIVATLLAIDPAGRWALLFDDTWAVLGDPLPREPRPDPSDVLACARAWLLRQMG